MTGKHITFRASHEDSERWAAAVRADDTSVSEVCRKALDRLANRVERRSTPKPQGNVPTGGAV